MDTFVLVPCGALFALGFALLLSVKIKQQPEGSDRMKEIASYIREGAKAYLKKQYVTVGIVFFIVFCLLLWKSAVLDFRFMGDLAYLVPFSFVSGGFFSALAGFFGMKIATYANNRTAYACQSSLNKGLRVAFNSGTVMGMCVVGLGLLHLSLWYFILDIPHVSTKGDMELLMGVFLPSGFGASAMALFARVGGGIFTKAADVGADLVGKVEVGIPEDDPRNPASIADNVGDNVGDVAGMGADLYESYIASIVATMAVAVSAFEMDENFLLFVVSPMVLAALGVFSSIIGSFFVRVGEHKIDGNALLWSLRKGIYIASGLMVCASFVFVSQVLEPMGWQGLGVFYAILIGLLVGNLIGYSTEYYTAYEYKPTQNIALQAKTGPATLIIAGLALGSLSTLMPVLIVVLGSLGAFYVTGGIENFTQGLYGVGMASVGMLSTLGITLATDAYGPVADNAGGIAQMSHLPEEVRERTDALDSLGNTTAATGKGFAIGSAALTALILLVAYIENIKHILQRQGASLESIKNMVTTNIIDPSVIAGLFLGAVLPFFFSALTMNAVGRAASKMVEEVRRQFKEISGIMLGKVKPDYAQCVAISTLAAQKEMIAPALLAILTPVLIGIFSTKALIALLAGSLVCGFVLAVMMANAGGSWDNAKKYIENGMHGGKGSDAHKAAVIGDTVGDPLKDTSGPSINILLKLMAMVSIIFASFMLAVNS